MMLNEMFKPLLRDGLANFLSFIGATDFTRYPKSKLVVITFHRVLPDELRKQYPLPGLAVTPSELSWVIKNLKPHFDIHTITESCSKLAASSNEKPLLSITFDDGQWDNLEYGLPILEQEDVKATFYIPTDFVGTNELLWHDIAAFSWQSFKRINKSEDLNILLPQRSSDSAKDFLQHLKTKNRSSRIKLIENIREFSDEAPSWTRLMNWHEINQLARTGHEIGSHAKSHQLLGQLSEFEQNEELVQSSAVIRKHIGSSPTSFCYPDGNYNATTLKILEKSSYHNAVTTKWGTNNRKTKMYELQRCDIDALRLQNRMGNLSLPRFQLRLSGYQPGL